MPIIFLIRHGENEYVKEGRLAGRTPNVHLNQTGTQQADQLARYFSNIKIRAVYSSPLERTIETAQPIAAALNLTIQIRDGLNEVDFGDWQGKTLKSLRRRKLWNIVQSAPSQARFPGGESFSEAQLRIVNEIGNICSKHKPKDQIICISHSDMIKLLVAYYIGLPVDYFQKLFISPGSISAMYFAEMGGKLVTLNSSLSQPINSI